MTGYFRGTLKVIDIILNMRAHYVENAVLTRESYRISKEVYEAALEEYRNA